ncbi:hypothetical protein [Demequina aestuarii]|uniref:hypothetical protein n=1 Tax=Demequina aestuarii TaxID=327095 RepID=UPI000782A6F3|nr:hypothetical protein [Demequina aestuarii]
MNRARIAKAFAPTSALAAAVIATVAVSSGTAPTALADEALAAPVVAPIVRNVPAVTAPADIEFVTGDVTVIDVERWETVNLIRFASKDGMQTYASPRDDADKTGTLKTGDRLAIDRTTQEDAWSRTTGGAWVKTALISSSDPTYVAPPTRSYSSPARGSSTPGAASSTLSAKRIVTQHVYTSGSGTSQAKVDACRGAVWSDFGASGVAIAEHVHCGGAWILDVKVGDTIKLTGVGAGTYTVTGSKSVPKNSSASVLNGGLWLQTCYRSGSQMRLVAISRI